MDHRLRKKSQFNYIYKKGEKTHTQNFTLFSVKSRFECWKFGISISKKLGKANKRNLLKRRIKEIVRRDVTVQSHFNYVLLCHEQAPNLTFEQLKKELIKLFGKNESKKSD